MYVPHLGRRVRGLVGTKSNESLHMHGICNSKIPTKTCANAKILVTNLCQSKPLHMEVLSTVYLLLLTATYRNLHRPPFLTFALYD